MSTTSNALQQARAISAGMKIPGRKMAFEFRPDDIPRHWNDNDAFKSTFMNALSCLFPEGERMFMDAVREHMHLIDDEVLAEQVRGFIKQEAIHGNEHALYNACLKKWHYPIDKINRFEKNEKRWMKKWIPASHRLAVTCALEHFTAIMANQVLTNPDATAGMHPQFKELWRWHAIEETEHKAVAYDVSQQAVGRYWLRVLTMINVTFFFCLRTSIYQTIFLWKDGQLFNPKTWWQGIRFYFIRPALVRRIMRQYLDYFRRDFHPWMHDNRELVQHWLTEEQSFKTL